jgi:phage FluMu protein Com
MANPFRCPCGKKLLVKDEFAGKRIKCPACGVVLAIPVPGTTGTTIPISSGGPHEFPPKSLRQPTADRPHPRHDLPGSVSEKTQSSGASATAVGDLGAPSFELLRSAQARARRLATVFAILAALSIGSAAYFAHRPPRLETRSEFESIPLELPRIGPGEWAFLVRNVTFYKLEERAGTRAETVRANGKEFSIQKPYKYMVRVPYVIPNRVVTIGRETTVRLYKTTSDDLPFVLVATDGNALHTQACSMLTIPRPEEWTVEKAKGQPGVVIPEA